MECREARRLLDDGVSPGSASREQAELGFHLAGCAECRSYRTSPDDYQLLADLLAQGAPAGRTVAARRTRRTAPGWLGRAGRLLLVLVCLAGLYYLGSAALAVATIAQNLRSMQAPTPPLATLAPLPLAAPVAAAGVDPAAPIATPIAGVEAGLAPPVATPAPQAEQAAVATTAPGAEPQGGVTATPAPAGWPTAPVRQLATPTLTPVPLGGETTLVQATQQPGLLAPLGFGAPPPSGGPVNVLLLGIDRRPGEGGPARMDAIIIARLDPEKKRVALLSLPRDLIVSIPGYGQGRINAASVYGELYPALGGGAASARNTVSELLGIPIDHVVHIDFQGFIKAVDAVGGVTIDVPTELYDAQYPTMDYGYTTVHFLPGPQHMDGETALKYARVRHMDSDFERTKRQQQVIVGAVAQLRGQNALQQLNSVASISSALRGYLTFDIPEERLASLVWSFRDITPEQVERYSLDGSQVWIGAPGDPYAVFAAPGALEGLVAQLLGP
jgi:polyisoprenyl-teichoic acid--peptidoglycan teichoic acid transferase